MHSQKLLNGTMLPLSLPIPLGVVGSGSTYLASEEGPQFFPKEGGEPGVSIVNDRAGDSIVPNNMVEKQLGHLRGTELGCTHGTRDEFGQLGQTINASIDSIVSCR